MHRIAIALMGAASLTACSVGSDEGSTVPASGSGPTRTYAVEGFDRIAVAGGDDVDVRAGTAFSVRAEGPADELDRLRIARDGRDLVIGRQKRVFGFGGGKGVKVFVTLPRLSEANIVGSGTMMVDRIEGTTFEANIAGSGDLNIAALTTYAAEVNIAGAGTLRAGGAIKRLEANVMGSGSLDAAGLRVGEADVTVAGSGNVRAAVSGRATVELMGSGNVDLGAAAQCDVSKKGSGSVRCGR